MEKLFGSTSEDDYSDFSSLLTCAMCQKEFKEPMMLPCLHSMCRVCLGKYINASASPDSIQCPQCYKECKVSSAGAGGFQRNYFVVELKKILDNRAKRLLGGPPGGDVFPTVDDDSTQNGNGNPFEDDEEVVENQSEKSGSHNEENRDEAKLKKTVRPMCVEHPDEELSFYCGRCNQGVCSSCSWATHKLHWCKKLTSLAEDFDQDLMQLTQDVEACMLRLGRVASDLDSKERRMMTDLDQASMKVAEIAQTIRDFVNQHEGYVQAKIRQIAREGLELITTSREQVELAERSVVGLKTYVEGLVAVGSLFDQACHITGLKEHVKNQDNRLQKMKTVRWSFRSEGGGVTSRQVMAMLGEVDGELSAHNVYWPAL